jgi:hypothetical protein
MWHHYCPCEETVLSVEDGEPCNWCDTPPQDPPDEPVADNPYAIKDRAND